MVQIKKLKEDRYAWILGGLTAICGAMLLHFRNRIRASDFLIYLAIGAAFGWTWQFFVSWADPNWPGWWYAPGKAHWYIFKVSFEDLVFYPICGALFYLVRMEFGVLVIKYHLYIRRNYLAIRLLWWALLLLAFACCSVFADGGVSIAWWFAIPGLVMMYFNRQRIDLVQFILTGIFIIGMATVWDLWVRDWQYITPLGEHSSLWLPYRWAWIGHSPIEITPGFSLWGWIFIYNLAETIERVRKR